MSSRSHLRTVLVAVVAVAAVAAVGCGSSTEPEPTVTGTLAPSGSQAPAELSKTEYRDRANAVCRDANEQIDQASMTGEDPNEAPGGIDDAGLREQAIQVSNETITDLEALPPPADDAAEIEAGIEQMKSAVATAQSNPDAPASAVGLPNQKLYDYGLTECFSQEEAP